jgi:hypothetical protein
VAAEAPDLTKATRIAAADVAPGDRILAMGQPAEDPKCFNARSIIVMTRSDLAQKRQSEQQEWQKRGASGTVASVDPGANTFSLKSGQKIYLIQASVKTEFRRYAADSVRFSDALISSLAVIKVGDQARILGDKSSDGASIAAERVVSGSFQQIAANVSSVNGAAGEIVIKDLGSKKSLTVRVTADSTLRKLPSQMAASLARRYQPGGGGGRGGNGEDVGSMLDHLAAMPLAELKAGDAIMLSTTTGANSGRVTAVIVLAGVEPLLAASPTAARDILSGWNLGNAGEGGQ